MFNWIVRNRTVWTFNCVINDWCLIELLEIEQFEHLTV